MLLRPVRPRFRLDIDGTIEDAIALVSAAARTPEKRCVFRVLGNHVDITVSPEDRHRWSPCIQLEFSGSEEGDGRIAVNGLVGPHPNVWTLYAFANICIAVLVCIGVMLGAVQLSLDQHPWGMWGAAAALFIMILLYLTSQIGQRCAADQTRMLLDLVKGALEE